MKKTQCQLLAEKALSERIPHYHAAYPIKDQIQYFDNYKGRKGFFIKKFLINDKINLNDWGVTWAGMKADVWDFIGQPVVLTPDKDHPSVAEQEDFRVGEIIDVGLDEINHSAWQVSHIFDERAQQMIKNKEIEFGSPTVLVRSLATREQKHKGTQFQQDILHRFRPAHDALVANPAYGKEINNIVAACEGDGEACALKLLEVSASVRFREHMAQEVDWKSPKIQKQLAVGVLVEMEHTDDPAIATKIAMDHLKEFPDYYTRLHKVIPDVPKVGSEDNINQITVVPFVKDILRNRYTAQCLERIVNKAKTQSADSQDCVSRKIKIISDEHPKMDHDQVIAIAYSYCKKNGSEKQAAIETDFIATMEDLKKNLDY